MSRLSPRSAEDPEHDAACASSDMDEGAPFVQGTPTFIVLFNEEGRIIPGVSAAGNFHAGAAGDSFDQVQ